MDFAWTEEQLAFRKAVVDEGVEARFRIDSAGTSGYHDGDAPDARTTQTARRRGVTVDGRSRRIAVADLGEFDYVVVMDEDNLRAVEGLVDTGGGTARVARLREYDPEADGDLDVPDPYFGGPEGFENVHDMVERSTRALLERIRKEHGF